MKQNQVRSMIYFMRISSILSIQQAFQILIKINTMGIDGLLPLLKPLCKQQHISSFKGQRLGIDILPWLYKGCYSYVLQLSEKQLKEQLRYSCANFLYEMLEMLAQNEIKVIAVLDGRSLPLKADTIKKRKETRESSNKKGEKMIDQNNVQMGRKLYARGIRINEQIIAQAISILNAKNIDFIVAPYESDSQLSKLKNLGLINAVVSQDSDLIVYGCNVIYKLDEEGMCQYLDLGNYKNLDPQVYKSCKYLKQFLNFDHDTRICACVLAGCDYVSSIKGIGIKKAINLLEKQNDIVKLIQNLALDKLYAERVPIEYKEIVINSIKIFKYATVFNPIKKQLESLNHLDMSNQGQQLIKILGSPYKQYIELQIFSGKIIANSLLPRRIIDIKQKRSIEIENTNLKVLVNEMGLGIDEQPTSSLVQDNMFEALKVLESENKSINVQNCQAQTIFWQNLVNLSIISILQL